MVGQDIPAAIDEHTAPHPIHQRRAILSRGKWPAIGGGGQFLARDTDHAVLNLFDGVDHGGPPRIGFGTNSADSVTNAAAANQRLDTRKRSRLSFRLITGVGTTVVPSAIELKRYSSQT